MIRWILRCYFILKSHNMLKRFRGSIMISPCNASSLIKSCLLKINAQCSILNKWSTGKTLRCLFSCCCQFRECMFKWYSKYSKLRSRYYINSSVSTLINQNNIITLFDKKDKICYRINFIIKGKIFYIYGVSFNHPKIDIFCFLNILTCI